MANYLEVINPATGAIQVNDNYMNFQVVRSGRVTCNVVVNPQTNPVRYKGVVTYSSNTRPLIAVNSDVYVTTLTKTSGTTYTFEILAYSLTPVVVEYFILDSSSSLPRSNYGLQVFRADGSMVLDAVQPCMRIVGAYTGSVLTPGDPIRLGPVTRNIPGKKLAVVNAVLCVAFYFLATDPGGDPNNGYLQYEFGVFKTAPGSITYDFVTPFMELGTASGPTANLITYQYRYNFLALDVTNYPVG